MINLHKLVANNTYLTLSQVNNIDWRNMETQLGVTSSKELRQVLINEGEYHSHKVVPNKWYWEDAFMTSENSVPCTKAQLVKRAKAVFD